MEKFTSIESFKHIVQGTRKYFGKVNRPLPTITFEGTVKLHGTNAGVRRDHLTGELQAQSRENEIFVGKDNAGFAFFVETNKDAIKALFVDFPKELDVTLFGEWCGGNIQKSVALNQVADKHWVLFAAKIHYPIVLAESELLEEDDPNEASAFYYDLPRDLFNHDAKVYNIYEIPTYEVTVDFLSPEPASEILSDLTLTVEKECPWSKLIHGVTGVGEGIVWHSKDDPADSRYWFKTKGLLHKNAGDTSKVAKIKFDDDKLASIKELVSEILPQWRLEQGISYLKENGFVLLPESTGEYLKWIAKDIIKEEVDTIAASGFDWKSVQGQVMQTARNHYLTEIQKEF